MKQLSGSAPTDPYKEQCPETMGDTNVRRFQDQHGMAAGAGKDYRESKLARDL